MANSLRFPTAPSPTGRRLPHRAVRADAFYFPKEIDNSRLVKVADPRERRAQHRLVLVSLLLAVAILAAACQRFAIVRSGYRLEELKEQQEQLLEANRQLRLEEASLRDPKRVDTIARIQLGFATPAPSQVRPLEPPLHFPDRAVVARAQPPPLAWSVKAAVLAVVP